MLVEISNALNIRKHRGVITRVELGYTFYKILHVERNLYKILL